MCRIWIVAGLNLLLTCSAWCDESAKRRGEFDHQFVQVTGVADERMRSFDELMISFVREHRVPGAALAVADGERLVYARGFGFTDLESKSPVLPTSLFRIASISKPITAVATMQLVERGQLRLDEKAFDILQVEPHLSSGATTSEDRLSEITVLQLLQHTGGWDRDQSFDPMFRSVRIAKRIGSPPPASAEAIIRYMTTKPLDFSPGERYAYSNFGYSLLGRIIEKRSGQSYEQFVRENIFQPLGITQSKLGRTRDRASFEVRYYDELADTGPSVFESDLGQQVPQPYGAWYLEAMDAHGGWLSSPIDLVRFASAVHGGSNTKLVNAETLKIMFERPSGLAGYTADGQPTETYYGCGWMVRPQAEGFGFNAWHTGSLPGTSTLLVTRHDGRHWAILFNTRNNPENQRLSSLIDPLLHQAADAVSDWSVEDQFPLYFGSAEEAKIDAAPAR